MRRTALYIHGGPNCAFGANLYQETQLMAANGYGVFYCNPPGSIGYGGEFADLRGKYYTIDYDAIMEFLEEALARSSWADRDRLAVTGGSYGGMMVNRVITHTDRFKAAVSDCCCVNEIADYFLSDIGFAFGRDVHGAALWDGGAAEKMWDKSPVKYAQNVKTPTLFVHGADDFRCSAEQSLQMMAALKYHGVDARAVIVKGERHAMSFEGRPKSRVRRFEEILSWYAKYLGGGKSE
jgi:dipeptidyl aminopeptidase/acylaminoacyl peptidase